MTYMWPETEEKGEDCYRFQTDEKDIAVKMSRRKRFGLAAYGMNCDLWIYQVTFSERRKAIEALESLTGKIVQKSLTESLYWA